jgi:hypothetical protein
MNAGRVGVVMLLVVAVALGCTGHPRSAERYYRVSAMASTPKPHREDESSYLVQLGEGVEYTIQAAVTGGDVRLRTALRNLGSESVRYDLQRTVVAAADGGVLRLAGTEEAPGSPPTEVARGTEHDTRGVSVIAPGQRVEIARRYVLADGLRRGRDPQLIARLSVADVVRIGDRDAWVKLRLEETR